MNVLGIEDVEDIIPDEDDVKPVDPVTAVQNIITGKPVKAFIDQDHEAHIAVVTSAQQDPEIQQLVSRVQMLLLYLLQVQLILMNIYQCNIEKKLKEKWVLSLPPEGEPIPADVEKRISSL